MFSSHTSVRTPSRRRPGFPRILILSTALLLVLLAVGCGGTDQEDKSTVQTDDSPIIAKVGKGFVTAEYYEDRLSIMSEKEIPQADGVPMDMATEAGKRAFLEVLINKELMYQKAIQLGYEMETSVVMAREKVLAYEAGLDMWEEVIEIASQTISEEELQDFYAQMGTEYLCEYVICNFEDDALEARKFALTGASWDEVVGKFHDGDAAPNGKYLINIPFGQYSPDFEDRVFATEEGGISQPIPSNYGFWIMKVNEIKHNKKPDLEQAKAQILDTTRNRKVGRLRKEFKDKVHAEREFQLFEDALWAICQGIPEGGMMDPSTNEPLKRDQLKELDISTDDLGLLLFSYRNGEGELVETTVSDYKNIFDKMNVFQRPKRADMLGGLRQKVITEVERGLLNIHAKKHGYFEKPDVLARVDFKIEEIIVQRLYSEVVTFDDVVTPEQLAEFWVEHEAEYDIGETRNGRMVICQDRKSVDAARAALMDGKPWADVLTKFGVDQENLERKGKTEVYFAQTKSPITEPIFSIEQGEISQPFPMGNNRWAVVQVEVIKPAVKYELNEVGEQVGNRIRTKRQEAAFQAILLQWADELGVEIISENLAGLQSWKELTAVIPAENVVPRN